MKTDRELLELAAKAHGGFMQSHYDIEEGGLCDENSSIVEKWNPLTDDGDALRLAIQLDMSVEISDYESSTYAYAGEVPRKWAMETWHISRNDKCAATRRAIVRAAAAIGETM